MSITAFDRLGRARIVQLVAKSNQFNLTTRHYNDAQIEALESDPAMLHWQAWLRDVFGDHGMVGVVIVRKSPAVWHIDAWLMSCRVLERRVERVLMQSLFDAAGKAGAEVAAGVYQPTDRNRLVEGFFPQFGFREVAGADAADKARRYALRVSEFRREPTFIDVASDVG